jgi:hypothetical protein
MCLRALLGLELRLLTADGLHVAMMCLFGLIILSALLTAARPRNVRVGATRSFWAAQGPLMRELQAQDVIVVGMPDTASCRSALEDARLSALLSIPSAGRGVIDLASIGDETLLEDVVMSAELNHDVRDVRRSMAEHAGRDLVLNVQPAETTATRASLTIVGARLACCLWLVAAVLAVVSWILTIGMYDQLVRRYSVGELIGCKIVGAAAITLVPVLLCVLGLGLAGGGWLELRSFLATGACGVFGGAAAGVMIGSLPLLFAGGFRDIAFVGVMGISMLWLGLVMAAGISYPIGLMLPTAARFLRWNPLHLLLQVTSCLSSSCYEHPVRAAVPQFLRFLGTTAVLVLLTAGTLTARNAGGIGRGVHARKKP